MKRENLAPEAEQELLRGQPDSGYMGVVLYPGCTLESSEELIKKYRYLSLIQLVRGRALLLNTVPPLLPIPFQVILTCSPLWKN